MAKKSLPPCAATVTLEDYGSFPAEKLSPAKPQEALKREIREELASEISVGELIDTVEFDYPTFHLSMDCFWCQLIRGNLELLEAAEARWLTKETLKSVDWLPADSGLIECKAVQPSSAKPFRTDAFIR